MWGGDAVTCFTLTGVVGVSTLSPSSASPSLLTAVVSSSAAESVEESTFLARADRLGDTAEVEGGGDVVVAMTGGEGDGDRDLVSGGGDGLTGLDDPDLDGDLDLEAVLEERDTDLLDGLELPDSLSASLD